ncbi:hypothetical protein HYDPIDRAFT_137722 [Hydnomerulius pinastri MD-312]|uniref:Major facilitator superfamily (MFS) profile domain-containing protein n=1 Tax=Hydnomerulius pinastri MD-312 TaxID=994086 RepID=A0A0C9W4K2_9AGAM|nr:hypothetical protein HYDPIDRAFT_137722 [Hydnomerulius pinastri MD-312]
MADAKELQVVVDPEALPSAGKSSKNDAGVTTEATQEKPFSIYTLKEKWFIVFLASVAAVYSPLSANIYFPAIPQISDAFHRSIELINLTVTVYMVFQGVSPMLWGSMADRIGRRPVFLACLLVLAASCLGLALVPTSEYWALLLLRCVQAAGSASTIALGAGVIGDISTPAERGGFFGLFMLGPQLGPAIGPVIGGAVADKLGWRWIFWIMCILSATCFIFILIFLPETLRRMVGDGSVMEPRLYRPLLSVTGRGRKSREAVKPPSRPLANPFRLFTYPDILTLLFFNGVVYAIFYSITTSISPLLTQMYPFLSETDLGLCYLATGGGMFLGSLINGKLLDHQYAAKKKQLVKEAEAHPEKGIKPEDVTKHEHFPIERTRLQNMPIVMLIFAAACAGFGWSIQRGVSLAVPLILQIIVGAAVLSVLNTCQTLTVDMIPSQSSSVTACNNLVRCSMGAALVSVIDLIINAIGPGWTFVALAGGSLAAIPLIWLTMWTGPRCRAQRRARNTAT